jgi:hypothetical protein
MLQHGQLFDRDLKDAAPSAARIFHPQLSLENVFNRKDGHKEVARHYPGPGKRMPLSKYLKLFYKMSL